jgi:hypothetical protein
MCPPFRQTVSDLFYSIYRVDVAQAGGSGGDSSISVNLRGLVYSQASRNPRRNAALSITVASRVPVTS